MMVLREPNRVRPWVSVVHGLFDFSILTGTVILVDQDPYVGSAFAILAYVVVAVVLLVRRHSIELPQKDPTFTP